MEPILNLNIGILGHVDSGKTTFAKALSTVESTASFDKSPESQNRGITLDLGFSATFIEDIPAPLNGESVKSLVLVSLFFWYWQSFMNEFKLPLLIVLDMPH